ncbi:MAG: hypothetical protein LUH02_07745 [Erysipelotrichaceae bacterium]|nr:hypothetical protein [Erysipelotrichaceae bacterium]
MKIYKGCETNDILLNPDNYYHNYDIHSKMYSFYKSLDVPDNVENITGIHIFFKVNPYNYETDPIVYQKFATKVLEKIIHYFDEDNAYVYFDESNDFYIVTYNETAENLCNRFYKLYHEFKNTHFQYEKTDCAISIKTGIFIAPKNVNAYYLYEASQNVLKSALKHHKTYISILES